MLFQRFRSILSGQADMTVDTTDADPVMIKSEMTHGTCV